MPQLNLQHPVSRQMQQLLKAGWSLQLIWMATVAVYVLLYTTLGLREQRTAACEQQQVATPAGLKSSTPCNAVSFGRILQSAVLRGSFTVMLAVLVVLWVCDVLAWLGVGVRSTPAQCSSVQIHQQLSKLHHPSSASPWTSLVKHGAAATFTKGPDSKQQHAAGQMLPEQQHARANLAGQHTGVPDQRQQLYSSAAQRASTHVQQHVTPIQQSLCCSSRLPGAGQAIPAAQHPLQRQHPCTATPPWAGQLGTPALCDAGALDCRLVFFRYGTLSLQSPAVQLLLVLCLGLRCICAALAKCHLTGWQTLGSAHLKPDAFCSIKQQLLKQQLLCPPPPTLCSMLTLGTVCPIRLAGSLIDVWVLAGQSNCVGTNFEDGQSMPAAAAPMPGEILCFNSTGRSLSSALRVGWAGWDAAGLGWARRDQLSCV
jgi:hypothetical protein